MILHIFCYDKFDADYINRINSLYEQKEQLFFIYGEKKEENIRTISGSNVIFNSSFISTIAWKKYLAKKIEESSRVIIHSLFSRQILSVLVWKQRRNCHKYHCVFWGADLYNAYWDRHKNLSNIVREVLRIHLIKKLPTVGYIKGDYEFLLKHYKTHAKFFLSSYTYDFFSMNEEKEETNIVKILLGNSASRPCQYEEMIGKLSEFTDKNFVVYCVLSYPKDEKYINSIVSLGKKLLGERFIPMTGFLEYNEYMKILNEIDIALFNHNRQQALGNIASLAYLGKKIYINNANACKGYFEDMGVVVYDMNDFTECTMRERMPVALARKNREAIEFFYSDEEFKKRWNLIFYSNMEE